MLLFHEVCHSSKIYLLIEGLKLENGILKEVGSQCSSPEAGLYDITLVLHFSPTCRYTHPTK